MWKKFAFLVAFFLIVLTTLSGCSKKEDTTGDTGNKTEDSTGGKDTSKGEEVAFQAVVGAEPDTIDPAINSSADGGTLCCAAFEGLTRLDTDGVSFIAGQARDWEISEDGLTYTFHLRDGLKWSDGSDLTAGDFIYAWNRAVDPETGADYEYMFDVIAGYEDKDLQVIAPDDMTLVVTLNAITPYFLELCAFPAFFPVKQEIVESAGEAWASDPRTYVGNGPFQLTEWQHNSYMLYERNENYWDAESVGPQSVKFVLMEDTNAQLAAYESGQVSFIDDCPTDEIKALKETPDFHIEDQLGTFYVSFNTQNEYLSNPLLRKALTLAVDRTYICEQITQAGEEPAGAFIAKGLVDEDKSRQFRELGGDYYDPLDYEGNVELAKQALEEAGYPNGEGLPTFSYLTNDAGSYVVVGEALQDMWSKIGVKIAIDTQEWNTFLNSRKEGSYDIARNAWLGDYNDPISFLDMWVTGGGNNDAQWSNAEYDSLIKDIKTTSDPSVRMQLMHEAEDIIFDEWMLCPLYYSKDIYLLKENVKGFYSSPLGYKFFQYVQVE